MSGSQAAMGAAAPLPQAPWKPQAPFGLNWPGPRLAEAGGGASRATKAGRGAGASFNLLRARQAPRGRARARRVPPRGAPGPH